MSLQQIEAIGNAVNDLLQFIRSRNQEVTSEEQTLLIDLLSQATQRVTQLRQELPPPGTPVTPGMPAGADLLWILAGGNPQVFTQYLQTVPDPRLNALLSDQSRLQSTIDHLQRTVTISAGESEDGIARAPIQSSNVYGFRYNPRNQRLLVRFQTGAVYQYDGVPAQVFKMFQSGAVPARTNGQNRFGRWWIGKKPSIGASFYQLVRMGGYPYQRIS